MGFLNTIINENCLSGLKQIPDGVIDCSISSPPYWGLRDYGHAEQLGNEKTFTEFITNLCNIYDEVRRVLKPGGTCFINLGDTYSGSNGAGYTPTKWKNLYDGESIRNKMGREDLLPDKCLCMIPERFAIEMTCRGWIIRNQIIWHKPNQMPQSATDRFTVDFEKVFFMVKQPKDYYFEQQLEPALGYDGRKELNYNGGNKDVSIGKHTRWKKHKNTNEDKGQQPNSMHLKREMGIADENYFERNVRTMWSINTEAFAKAHFAVYPEKLVERMIKAGCPKDGIVLDPFMGAGTTAVVARKLGRNFTGFELNPEYLKMANERLYDEMGMFL